MSTGSFAISAPGRRSPEDVLRVLRQTSANEIKSNHLTGGLNDVRRLEAEELVLRRDFADSGLRCGRADCKKCDPDGARQGADRALRPIVGRLQVAESIMAAAAMHSHSQQSIDVARGTERNTTEGRRSSPGLRELFLELCKRNFNPEERC